MSEQLDLFTLDNHPLARALQAAGDDMLPPLAREMVEVMGLAATMALVAEMGGQRLRVPGLPLARPSSRYQALEDIVGGPAAVAFAERWGDLDVAVPKCDAALRAHRNRRLISEAKSCSVDELARRYRMTRRYVFRVLGRR